MRFLHAFKTAGTHTKRHPAFFQRLFGEEEEVAGLQAPSGRYQALHYHYVSYAVGSFGLFYTRFYQFEEVRKMMAENLSGRRGVLGYPAARARAPRSH